MMCVKGSAGMVNSENHDQTALEQSNLGLNWLIRTWKLPKFIGSVLQWLFEQH